MPPPSGMRLFLLSVRGGGATHTFSPTNSTLTMRLTRASMSNAVGMNIVPQPVSPRATASFGCTSTMCPPGRTVRIAVSNRLAVSSRYVWYVQARDTSASSSLYLMAGRYSFVRPVALIGRGTPVSSRSTPPVSWPPLCCPNATPAFSAIPIASIASAHTTVCRVRPRAMLAHFSCSSIPMPFRPRRSHAASVSPVPANGSRTVPPRLVKKAIIPSARPAGKLWGWSESAHGRRSPPFMPGSHGGAVPPQNTARCENLRHSPRVRSLKRLSSSRAAIDPDDTGRLAAAAVPAPSASGFSGPQPRRLLRL